MQLQHMPGCFCVLFQHTTVYSVYTHMDIMQAILAIVYTYIVMGEFKGRLGENMLERTRMKCVTITVLAL